MLQSAMRKYNAGDLEVFKLHYLQTGNATESMLKVNNRLKRDSASVIGNRLLSQVKIRPNEYLEQAGITPSYLANKTKEGLEATKVVTSPVQPDYDVPDYAIRHKYLETSYKLRGELQNSNTTINQDNRRVVIALPAIKQPTST